MLPESGHRIDAVDLSPKLAQPANGGGIRKKEFSIEKDSRDFPLAKGANE